MIGDIGHESSHDEWQSGDAQERGRYGLLRRLGDHSWQDSVLEQLVLKVRPFATSAIND